MLPKAGRLVQLIANPATGRHQRRLVQQLEGKLEALGAGVRICHTRRNFPVEIDLAADHLCIVGGDGTIRLVAEAVIQSARDVPISIYPGGTINLVHRELDSTADLDSFAASVAQPHSEHIIFPGLIDGGVYLACASCGPDSRAVWNLNAGLKRRLGRVAYLVSFLRLLVDWHRPRIRLVHEGGELECEAFHVAKGRYYAGPWSIAPEARLDEPLMHVVALRRVRRRDYLRFAWRVLRGRSLAGWDNAVIFACKQLAASSDDMTPIQADGDPAGHLPASLAVSQRGLRIN